MESTDQYNFSIFRPRNLHGRKNRNVIFSMLIIWALAVFGFQFLLRIAGKPTPEKSLSVFETVWPAALSGDIPDEQKRDLLMSLIHVKGKSIVTANDQVVLNGAISSVLDGLIPDSLRQGILTASSDLQALKAKLASARDQEYLSIKLEISTLSSTLFSDTQQYTGIDPSSLEASILASSIRQEFPSSLSDGSLNRLPGIMKLYLTHNQSKLTDTTFLGFPFHYFYTAVFLLILFIGLCIVYNILIEWRLKQGKIVE